MPLLAKNQNPIEPLSAYPLDLTASTLESVLLSEEMVFEESLKVARTVLESLTIGRRVFESLRIEAMALEWTIFEAAASQIFWKT